MKIILILSQNVQWFFIELLMIQCESSPITAQSNTNVELRLYVNSQSYACSGGWAMYFGTTTAYYDIVDMYKTKDN